VDAWQLRDWEAYRDVQRLGRKTRLSEPQRKMLWDVFSAVHGWLEREGLHTRAAILAKVSAAIEADKQPLFQHAVIDEAQDLGVPELRFLAALGGDRTDGLFFAGDLGQRIFRQPFSWKALGVDVRGRSTTLRVNYRTSHQIRRQADLLLPPELSDVDGNEESRKGTVSVFNGPRPCVEISDSEEEEISRVSGWLKRLLAEGLQAEEIGVFVRSRQQFSRAQAALDAIGVPAVLLDDQFALLAGHVAVSSMHLAKGLEFRAVIVMACDDEVIPLQSRIESVTDTGDLEDVYNTERHLLYVACTRARDRLFVSGVAPASEFMDDMCEH